MAEFQILHHFKGGTKAQYDAVRKAVHPANGLPEGQLYHTAGPTADGYAVAATWDSEQRYNDFRDNTLLPTLTKMDDGFQGPPEEIHFPVDNLEKA
jgi:heme-degrading monooxygenase HmoA